MPTDFDERAAMCDGLDWKKEYLFILNSDFMFSEFELTKIDTNLNVQFQKYINTDCGFVVSVTATNDGGCIVIINAFGNDWSNKRTIKLYKFDADGNLPVDIYDENIKISNFVIFPNPISDILKIKKAKQVPKAYFIMYNIAG